MVDFKVIVSAFLVGAVGLAMGLASGGSLSIEQPNFFIILSYLIANFIVSVLTLLKVNGKW